MRPYEQIVAELSALADERYRPFNERVANIPAGSSLGVRMPALRAFGKALVREEGFDLSAFLDYPQNVYEVRLLQGYAAASVKMPFVKRMEAVARFVPAIDGWSVCDFFCSCLKDVKRHRGEMFPYLACCVESGREFFQRFAYVLLLGCYMDEAWLPAVFSLLDKVRGELYYAHMGAAWLLAEVLVKFYERGVNYLAGCPLEGKTVNKAIQKARESFRLTQRQKDALLSLRRK